MLTRTYDEALRPAGVSASQFELMMVLQSAPGANQSTLATLLDTDQTTLSRNLKLLLDQRWLETARDEQDGRRQNYRLSGLGTSVLGEATRNWQQVHQQMERSLGAPMSELWPVLNRIIAAARAPAAAP